MPPGPDPAGGSDLPGDAFLRVPHPDRLDPHHPAYDDILRAHGAALDAGEAGYRDPVSGLFVLTAGWLWARGTCCDQGCRHCPYVGR
ncbi:MAG TPA: DUF5522 domain-containing protein [Acidimicrobiales bacterium]|nr:DUF5522 domain-containing protein [Acidimicrobiales bacterium]